MLAFDAGIYYQGFPNNDRLNQYLFFSVTGNNQVERGKRFRQTAGFP